MKKTITILLSMLLVVGLLSGCGSASKMKTNDDFKGQTVTGEVKKVSSGSLTISVDNEDAVIKVDDDTEISGGGGPTGQPPSGDQNGQPPSGGQNGQPPSGDQNGQPPDKPGDSSNSESKDSSGQQSGQPPEPPSGDNNISDSKDSGQPPSGGQNGQPPEMPGAQDMKLTDIKEGDTVSITFSDSGKADKIEVMPSGNGSGQKDVNYTAVKTYDSDTDVSGETVKSTGDDENAVLVKDGKVTLSDMTVTRDSDSSSGGDEASFYGLSAAVLGTGGTTSVKSSEITTDADGGAGVFSYGDAKVYVSDTKIRTANGASGGIHAAGGGTLYAWDLDVVTEGRSSAAIRSDRGGGTMVVDGGTYTSKGTGSPAIYSTADITVHNADLTAEGSEAICIEGKNAVRLFDCDLSGSMKDDEQNDYTWNVILYQSMSGDSEEGTSVFQMDGGKIKAANGGMFYTTNTSSKFVLKDVDITYADDNDFFLKATGNSNKRGWGETGKNGADTDFTAISQDMEGDVIWDSISTVDFYMTDGSTLKGAFVKDDSNAGDGEGGSCSVYISKDSTWTVTGDSTVTALYSAGTIKDADGKTVTVKDADGKVLVKGTSKYTVTCEKYSTKDKTSGADSISSWSEYKVEQQ